MAATEVDPSTIVYCDKVWIQFNGGWLHSNNILFYFAQSPFFDKLSSNNTIITQNTGIPERELRYLSTKQRFEEELTKYAGVQYVVDQDPMEQEVLVDGVNGKERSMIWIIKKFNRKRARSNDIEILGYYYIIDDTIYQAPNMFKILEYRLMNACLAIDKVVNTTMNLPPYFSVSNGYSYLRPGQKSSSTVAGAQATQSRLGTPMPDNAIAPATQDRGPTSPADSQEASEQTLKQALDLVVKYYDQYDDDTPLMGEPGNFRYAKSKNPMQGLKASETSKSAAPSKAGTPAPTQSTSALTASNGPFANGSIDAASSVDPLKRRMKKSRAVNEL